VGIQVRWRVLPAVVLAAGDSTRMGSPKALLAAPDGRPFVARVVATLAAAGLENIVVVTGKDHDAVVSAACQANATGRVRFVRNHDPSRGQLSSLLAGMEAVVSETTEGVLVTLVDVPLVTPDTITRVIDVWRFTRAPVVRPAIGDRHGHPVIFDRAVFDELRRAPLAQGAKAVARAHAGEVVDVGVGDEGCLVDVDTPEDYRGLLGR
jgi:molybdenum cofactor cytidylyltransferase